MTDNRRCRTCRRTKPLVEFPICSRSIGGHRRQCKRCGYARQKARLDPKAEAARRIAYFTTPGGKAARSRGNKKWRLSKKGREYNRRPEVREKLRLKAKNYRARELLKVAARNAVRSAKARGVLAPASTLPCNRCGKKARDYHHHKGYDPEFHLDVIPLCDPCHTIAG